MIRKIWEKIGSLGKFVGKIRKGPHLISVRKLGKFNHIRKVHQANKEFFAKLGKISPN